jgi:hypothetical protein
MLKKICTDLETSKRLKELGFDDSESEFVYWKGKPEYYHNLPFFEIDRIQDLITCYTLEQILNELPQLIKVDNNMYHLVISKNSICYYSHSRYAVLEIFLSYEEGNIATAAAKLWIKLKEDNVI